MVFDVMLLNDENVMPKPLSERRAMLQAIILSEQNVFQVRNFIPRLVTMQRAK
jgi:ATP-dependent DNA ligase